MTKIASFDSVYLADLFIVTNGPFATVGGLAYHYDKDTGAWQPLSQTELLKHIYKMNRAGYVKEEVNNKGVRTTTPLNLGPKQQNDIATNVMRDEHPADAAFRASPARGIAFRNRFVTIDDKKGLVDAPNAPENYATTSLPFDYDPEAKAPRFQKMLNELFAKDSAEDREAKKKALAQFYGACLFGLGPKFERCFILSGSGANGKSTFMEIMQDTLFQKTSKSVAPDKWDHEYYIASLHGARLNTVSEIPSSEVFVSEKFKQVITGDEQTGRHPGEKPFSFRPMAGHVFSANEMPQTGDVTEGFWRRFVVIPFTQKFDGKGGGRDAVKNPIIENEAPGIVNWAIEGVLDLRRRGGYTEPESHTAAMKEWKKNADVALHFKDSCCEDAKGPDNWTSVADLYASYRLWAHDSGHRQMSAMTFGRRLTQLGIGKAKRAENTFYALRLKESKYWVDYRGGGQVELKVVQEEKKNG